jgi:hypothetical protein
MGKAKNFKVELPGKKEMGFILGKPSEIFPGGKRTKEIFGKPADLFRAPQEHGHGHRHGKCKG